MSDNATSAGNQQGRSAMQRKPSETTCQTPVKKSEIIAYLHGALHDASLNKGKRIRFAQKHKEWLVKLKELLLQINCNSWIYKEGKDRQVYVLETLCKDLEFSFDPLDLRSSAEKVSYLSGFFDAEGGVPHTNGKFYIQLVQKDLLKVRKLKNMLINLGISSGKVHNPSHKVDPNYWRIFISTKDHQKFAKIIYSFHPIKGKILKDRMKI